MAALEVMDDAADEVARAGLLARLFPARAEEVRPAGSSGLAGRGQVHQRDAATLIKEEWQSVAPSCIVHRCVKYTILPFARSASFLSEQAECRQIFAGLKEDVDHVDILTAWYDARKKGDRG